MTTTNQEAFEKILAHHAQLVEGVTTRLDALDEVVRAGGPIEVAKVDLLTYLVDEVLTHAVAEENTLYVAASHHVALAETVIAMVAEHRELASDIEDVARSTTGPLALERARSVGALFVAHVARENDVLLPVLVDDASVELSALLGDMQRELREGPEPVTPLLRSSDDHEAVVVRHLLDAALALARAGEGEVACSLVGATWAALRAPRPDLANTVNLSLHRLARMVTRESAPPATSAAIAGPDERQLDVRSMAPAQRHEAIFATYDELATGTGFVLVNDHDPRPLQYQFDAEHAGEFTWDYLESGPRVWRVRIGRRAVPARAGLA